MEYIDELALHAANDNHLLSELIESQSQFILRSASKTSKKYISKNDDEWSIALIAFSDAVKTYAKSKGGFLHYAQTIIKNRLIDYYRSEQKYKPEYLVDPSLFECESNEEEADIAIKISVAKQLIYQDNHSIRDEIEAITPVINEYGFTFYDLASCSPKSKKTKEACKKVILHILENQEIMRIMKEAKQMPIKKIQKNTGLPRKLIEHHRRYIIAAIEILSGEYPFLAEYVTFIRKEEK